MALQPLTLSVDAALSCQVTPVEDHGNMPCAFCGAACCPWMKRGDLAPEADCKACSPACPLCILPQHLERPRIDQEAALVWLPEISQPALNASMREIHMAIQGLGEDVHADAVFRKRSGELRNVYYARAVLAGRREAAASRVGTSSPRELGLALLDLSPAAYARRVELLDGLRLMPLGRFFHDDKDVYPQIVAFWRNNAETLLTQSKGTP